MKKLLYIFILFSATVRAQSPTVTSSDRQKSTTFYIEPSTNKLWQYTFNGSSYKWINPLLASDSASTGFGYITLNYIKTHPFIEVDPIYVAGGAKLVAANTFTNTNTFNTAINAVGGMTTSGDILPNTSSSRAIGSTSLKFASSFVNTSNISTLKGLGAGISIVSAAGVTRHQIFENGDVTFGGIIDSAYKVDVKGSLRAYTVTAENLATLGLVFTDNANKGVLKQATLSPTLTLNNSGGLSVDTTIVRTVLNSYTKAQTDALFTNVAPTSEVISSTSGAGTISSTNPTSTWIATTTSAFTLTLPTSASMFNGTSFKGRRLTFKNIGTNNLTIQASGAELIDNANTLVVPSGQSVIIVSDGTKWRIIQNVAFTGNPIVEITGTTQAAAGNTVYIPHNAALTTITVPTTTTIGTLYQVIGEGSGGWKLQLPSGAVAVGVGGFTTTAAGSLNSTDRYCTLTIRYVTTNKFVVTTSQGTITPL